jgi:hypothetical protein
MPANGIVQSKVAGLLQLQSGSGRHRLRGRPNDDLSALRHGLAALEICVSEAALEEMLTLPQHCECKAGHVRVRHLVFDEGLDPGD